MIDPAWANVGIVAAGFAATLVVNKRSESRREGMVDVIIKSHGERLTKHGEEIDRHSRELGEVRERVKGVETKCELLHNGRSNAART
jgi:hypothetical protein